MSIKQLSSISTDSSTYAPFYESTPASMSTRALRDQFKEEISKYRRQLPSNDDYGLEILRRATLQQDQEAWAILHDQFGENVRLWFRRHANREVVLRYGREEDYVADAFRRFWQTICKQKLIFATLAAALSYLHLCLNSAILDTLRDYSRPKEIALSYDHDAFSELLTEDHYHENEVWEVIRGMLPTPKEKRLAYLHFCCNLKPKEIMRYCPGEFSNEAEIYQLKRNIMCRLLRDVDKIRWKLASEHSK